MPKSKKLSIEETLNTLKDFVLCLSSYDNGCKVELTNDRALLFLLTTNRAHRSNISVFANEFEPGVLKITLSYN